ncbi:unnamed protein product [Mytilus edulis]|uniref:Kazal-like domain-containing protein n=1 Tax=Mytilus edulis TaxID=6550 RepID=A0A8S3R0X2_MYTED|nr:unnamed protein product [Mytilus edulis]
MIKLEPVHGGWSAWGDWSPCSVSCGAGKRRRFRDCKNPAPSPSGRYCGDSWMQEDNCFIECELSCHFGSRLIVITVESSAFIKDFTSNKVPYTEGCYKFPEGKKDPCDGVSCHYGAICVPASNGINSTCKIPDRCDNYGDSIESIPVCGDDNRDYANTCEMRKTAFQQMRNITVKYFGKCEDNPCKLIKCDYGEVCRIDHEGKGHCECPPSCQLVINKVCGTDDVTYDNECELRRRACQNKTVVDIKHLGACGGEHCKTRCGHGARCVKQNGVETCVCPHKCQDGYFEPVCGSDGKTYKNFCRLQEYNCLQKTNIIKEHDGLCSKSKNKTQEALDNIKIRIDGGSGDEEVLLICEENVNCRFGGKCVTDGHFGYRCDCNKNCKAVRFALTDILMKLLNLVISCLEDRCFHL